MDTIVLSKGPLRVGISPRLGGGIADFSVRGPTGFYFPLMRRAAPGETNASLLGSFFMAPWVNRIAGAAFVFGGRRHALRPTTADNMAQHGDVRKRPWAVRASSGTGAVLEFDSRDISGADEPSNWPWAYRCRAEYSLDETGLTIGLSLTNTDAQPFPAGCGHHPYFMRRLWNDRDVLELRAPVTGRYPLRAGCAAGAAVPDELVARLTTMSPIPDEHLDAVFGGYGGVAELRWPASAVSLRMESSPNMGHLIVFAPHERPRPIAGECERDDAGGRSSPLAFIAVEPQTQVNDALNAEESGVRGTGTVVLRSGETLETRCRFTVAMGA